MDRKTRFTEIYKTNEFQGKNSVSGPGSDLKQTETIMQRLPEIFELFNIKDVVDAPCGDFSWFSILLPELKIDTYLGIDIVPEIIAQNINNYIGSEYYYQDLPYYNFQCLDIVEDKLPEPTDLLLCRDCLCHLSYQSINKFFKNFINSNIKYLLTTTFTKESRKNMDGEDGRIWYPINLMKEPFNLPDPILLINEECTEGNGDYNDKSLALWKREDLKNVFK